MYLLKRNIKFFGLLFLSVGILLAACSKEKRYANQLEGSWNADKDGDNSSSQRIVKTAKVSGSNYDVTVTANGSYTFEDDNTGEYSLDQTTTVNKDGSLIVKTQGHVEGGFNWEFIEDGDAMSLQIEYQNGNLEVYRVQERGDDKFDLKGTSETSATVQFQDPNTGSSSSANIIYDMVLTAQ